MQAQTTDRSQRQGQLQRARLRLDQPTRLFHCAQTRQLQVPAQGSVCHHHQLMQQLGWGGEVHVRRGRQLTQVTRALAQPAAVMGCSPPRWHRAHTGCADRLRHCQVRQLQAVGDWWPMLPHRRFQKCRGVCA